MTVREMLTRFIQGIWNADELDKQATIRILVRDANNVVTRECFVPIQRLSFQHNSFLVPCIEFHDISNAKWAQP